jgi:hypothetical protein
MALHCIEMLAATPEISRGLMCELSDEDARWKPAPRPVFCRGGARAFIAFRGELLPCTAGPVHGRGEAELEPDDAQMHLDLHRNADPGTERIARVIQHQTCGRLST